MVKKPQFLYLDDQDDLPADEIPNLHLQLKKAKDLVIPISQVKDLVIPSSNQGGYKLKLLDESQFEISSKDSSELLESFDDLKPYFRGDCVAKAHASIDGLRSVFKELTGRELSEQSCDV
jgi:hypothetical protein